jgi:hypothetical protein
MVFRSMSGSTCASIVRPDSSGATAAAVPAQLALALLADCVGDDLAVTLYQEFKRRVVANLPEDHWTLTSEEIEQSVRAILRKSRRARHECESMPLAKFRLGRIVATPNALSQVPNEEILRGIQRHQSVTGAMSATRIVRRMNCPERRLSSLVGLSHRRRREVLDHNRSRSLRDDRSSSRRLLKQQPLSCLREVAFIPAR